MKFTTVIRHAYGIALLTLSSFQVQPLRAVTLWSTADSFQGTGEFYGPGAFEERQTLFDMVLNNLVFITDSDFLTPFYNNGAANPNVCGERELPGKPDGRLSNGLLINENADMCLATVANTDMLIAVVKYDHSQQQGQQIFLENENGDITVSMELALDLGIGEKGVIKLPFYGTTGSVTVPVSLQTQRGQGGVDSAGPYAAGTVLSGRLGDFNHNGWLDGTLVATGVIPLSSPVFPGQPYAMRRHFETNIPIDGYAFGDVKSLHVRTNRD